MTALVVLLILGSQSSASAQNRWMLAYRAFHAAQKACEMLAGNAPFGAQDESTLKHYCAMVRHPIDTVQGQEWWMKNAPKSLQRDQTTWLCLLGGELPSAGAARIEREERTKNALKVDPNPWIGPRWTSPPLRSPFADRLTSPDGLNHEDQELPRSLHELRIFKNGSAIELLQRLERPNP